MNNHPTRHHRAAALMAAAALLLLPATLCMEGFRQGEAIVDAEAAVEGPSPTRPTETAVSTTTTAPAPATTMPTSSTTARPPQAAAERYYIPDIPLSRELQAYTFTLCQEQGISYELVLAVMQRESRFHTDAQGHNANGSCDSGLMQINSCNAGWLKDKHGIDDLMDPYQNIRAGTLMLSGHIRTYGENDGLMAYHMGGGGMRNAKKRGVTSTAYSRGVLETRDQIAALPKAA